MKRVFVGATLFAAASILAGCPVYSDGGNYRVCNSSGCYDCPDSTYSDACIPWQCNTADDCGGGYACNPSTNQCVPLSVQDAGSPFGPTCSSSSQCAPNAVCGWDQQCHFGDCVTFGCSPGYACWVRNGSADCVASSGPDASSGYDAAPPQLDASAPDVFDAHTTDSSSAGDAADAADAAPVVVTCNSDASCTDPGSRCIDGVCTAQSQLCSDSTQCTGGMGELCVDGVCTAQCSSASPCPIGYGCNLTLGACDLNPTACADSSACQGGTVCVDAHCVPPCSVPDGGDAGTLCPSGELCINGGCIPDQRATFTCKNDGTSGALANSCPGNGGTDVCIHGDCYTSCSFDGGGCPTSQVCTEVTIAQGTFAVCGNGSNLGSDCGPESGKVCASGQTCIDGHCR